METTFINELKLSVQSLKNSLKATKQTLREAASKLQRVTLAATCSNDESFQVSVEEPIGLAACRAQQPVAVVPAQGAENSDPKPVSFSQQVERSARP